MEFEIVCLIIGVILGIAVQFLPDNWKNGNRPPTKNPIFSDRIICPGCWDVQPFEVSKSLLITAGQVNNELQDERNPLRVGGMLTKCKKCGSSFHISFIKNEHNKKFTMRLKDKIE